MRGQAGLASLALALVIAGCGRDDPKQYTCADIRPDPEKREALVAEVEATLLEDGILAGATSEQLDQAAHEFTEGACRRLKPQGKPYIDLLERLQRKRSRSRRFP